MVFLHLQTPSMDFLNDSLTVSRQKELSSVLLRKPANLVDLLFYFQTLQVVELGLVALESAVNIVLAPELRWILILPGVETSEMKKKTTLDKNKLEWRFFCSIFDEFHFKKLRVSFE